MNFRRRPPDHPELNLIPMIDVLIVLLIFLMLTTTFQREGGLKIRLPKSAALGPTLATGIQVTINAGGVIMVDRVAVDDPELPSLKSRLAAAATGGSDNVIIRADRRTPHELVMRVLDAASQVGLAKISFALESPGEVSVPGSVSPDVSPP